MDDYYNATAAEGNNDAVNYYAGEQEGNAMEDQGQTYCKVYDTNDWFTVFVQALLCGIAFGSLYLKRLREVPRRKFLTWFLDVSKQGIGAVYAHVLNMIIANVIVQHVRGNAKLQDECAWYATMYIMDTVVGLLFCIMFLRLLDRVANGRDWARLKHSGVYVGNEGLITWAYQLTAWLVILTLVKIILFFLMWLFSGFLAFWAGILFKPFQSNIRFELLFVMIFFPGFLNIIWFWITDHYLKAEGHHKGAHEDDPNDSKQTALLGHEDNPNDSKQTALIESTEKEQESTVHALA